MAPERRVAQVEDRQIPGPGGDIAVRIYTPGDDGAVRVYKGIPFGAPPTGDLRWQAPRPAAAWPGVREATEFGPRCMQGQIFADIVFTNKSEDCLNLNLWTPAQKADERLPVMVWIHGGGFQAGSGAENRHDGTAFARRNVVIRISSPELRLRSIWAMCLSMR